MAVDADGLAIAVWQGDYENNWTIQSSTSLRGAAWSTPNVLTVATESAGSPQVAVNPSGLAVAVWDSSDIVRSSSLDNRIPSPEPTPVLPATGMSSASTAALLAGGAFLAVLGAATLVVSRQRKKSL